MTFRRRARTERPGPASGPLRRAKGVLAPLAAFLFPDSCSQCGAALECDERHLCASCRAEVCPAVRPIELPRLASGGAPGRLACEAYSLLAFEGASRALVHALKYGRRVSAASDLVRAVLPVLPELPLHGIGVVVPVPLHAARLRERGFNQAALLAAGLAGALDRPVAHALRRNRATREQAGLDRAHRLENVANAFAPGRARIDGARVLLVDDVVTTGATLAAAAGALMDSGAERVVCVALAGRDPGH